MPLFLLLLLLRGVCLEKVYCFVLKAGLEHFRSAHVVRHDQRAGHLDDGSISLLLSSHSFDRGVSDTEPFDNRLEIVLKTFNGETMKDPPLPV